MRFYFCVLSVATLLWTTAVLADESAPPLEGGAPEQQQAVPAQQPTPAASGESGAGVPEEPGLATVEPDLSDPGSNLVDGTPTFARDGASSPQTAATREMDSDGVFRAFLVLSRDERRRRFMGALGGVVVGATTMGVGAVVANETDTSKTPWLIIGGVTAGLSLLGIVMPSPVEMMAHKFRVAEDGHTPEEAEKLEQAWSRQADKLKKMRFSGGTASLVLGSGSLATGIAFAAGAANFNSTERATWSSVLIALGSSMMVGGIANFLVLSPTERAYAVYKQGQPQARKVELSLGAGSTDGSVALRGKF
jgi:hypothetical protein